MGIFAAGAERAEADDGLVRDGQTGVFQVELRAKTALFEKPLEVFRARFIAAEDKHAAACAKIALHIARGGLKTAAVARQRARVHAEKHARREQIARGRQRIEQQHGEGTHAVAQRLLTERKRSKFSAQNALFDQGLHVFGKLPVIVLAALQNAHAVADGDERIGGKVVERADLVGVAGGKITVHAAERQIICKALDVAAQRFYDGAVRRFFLDLLRGAGEALKHFFASAVRERGQHLGRGQDGERLDVLRAALGRKVEFAHRVHLVVEELDAHGRAQGRVNIQNTAAQGELSDALDRFCARVAAFDELFGKCVQIKARTGSDLRHCAVQRVRRQRALHQTVDRGDEDGSLSGGKTTQRADALLLPAVRGGHAVAQLPFAREKKACLLAEQRGQVERHAVCFVFICADDQQRTLRLFAHGGDELRAVHTRKARHGDGRCARVKREQQLAHLGKSGERFIEFVHPLRHTVSLLPQRAKGQTRRVSDESCP